MPESLIVKTKRDGTLTFLDNAANSFTVAFEAGDLSVTIPGPSVANFLDRGRFPAGNPSIRYQDDAPITGSFSAYLRDFDDGGTGANTTLTEIISRSGLCDPSTGTWVSTMGATGEVFALTLLFQIEGTDHGDPADHLMQLDYTVLSGSISEGDPDTISLTFSSYSLYPTVT